MNRSIGFSQPIVPNPCHFPRYSEEPKEKAQRIRQKWDPVSKRLVNCYFPQPSQLYIKTIAGNGIAGYSGDDGPAISAQLNYPHGISVDSYGVLYIADRDNYRIRKVYTTGAITTIAGNGTPGYSGDGGFAILAQIGDTFQICTDSLNNLYITDYLNNVIRKVFTSGKIVRFAGNGASGFSGDGGPAISAELNGPTGVCVDSSRNLYIADRDNQRIRKVAIENGFIDTIAGDGTEGYGGDGGLATDAQLKFPRQVAIDSDRNVYIADRDNHRIRKVFTNGTITTIAGNGIQGFDGDGGLAIYAKLNSPTGVCVDSLGNVYIADTDNNRIRKVNVKGIITTIAGDGTRAFSGDGGPALSADLDGPTGICLDSSGNLYIADSGNNRVRKLYYA